MQAVAAAASKHGDKDLQRATCSTTHMQSKRLPLPPYPTQQAAPNGKRHKLRQNAFFTRQNAEEPRATATAKATTTREMQSQVVISHIGEQQQQQQGVGDCRVTPLGLPHGRQSQHQSSRRQSVASKCLMSERKSRRRWAEKD